MMRTIRLYGRLAEMVGQRAFTIYARTAQDAAKFICVNFPHIAEKFIADSYFVFVGNRALSETEVADPLSNDDIYFIPVIQGAFGGIIRAIIGAVLIVAAIFVPFLAPIATAVIGVGVSLVLSGVTQLLTPQPPTFTATSAGLSNSPSNRVNAGAGLQRDNTATSDDKTSPRSTGFSNITNTSRQGLAVPIQYGEILVGSIGISIGQQTTNRGTTQPNLTPLPPPPPPPQL